ISSVHEDVELQFEGLSSRRGYNTLAFLAVASFAVGLNGFAATAAANIESKCVLPLFREPFGIDIVIPPHGGGVERLWHSAAGKLEVREARVTEIRLAHEDSVVALCKWATGG